MKILFVCTANICRSPTAHALFQKLVNEAHLSDKITVDSSGTHATQGALADPRSAMIASRKGINLGSMHSRPLTNEDFVEHDYILVMDHKNREAIERKWPEADHSNVQLLMNYATGNDANEVPDPYRGEAEDFIRAYELIDQGCRDLLAALRDKL